MTRIIREARPTDMAEIRQVMDAAKNIIGTRRTGAMSITKKWMKQ